MRMVKHLVFSSVFGTSEKTGGPRTTHRLCVIHKQRPLQRRQPQNNRVPVSNWGAEDLNCSSFNFYLEFAKRMCCFDHFKAILENKLMPTQMGNRWPQCAFLGSAASCGLMTTPQNSKSELWKMKRCLTPKLSSLRIHSKLQLFLWVFSDGREELTGTSHTMNLEINSMQPAHLPTEAHK